MNNILNCTGHHLEISNIVNSDGVYIIDDKGKQYMDLESGVWCTSLGHKNDRINSVIKTQIDSIMHVGFCYSNNIVEESAESVLSITGYKGGQCVYLCSGSEAIELARQISKHTSKKHISMTLHDSYLGSYSSVTERENNWFIFDWKKCADCQYNDNCNIDCEELQKIPTDISDFIFEPGSSSGYVRFPPKSLIQNIVQIVRNNGGKIIANEVTTGIGRTGSWFGFNHYQVEPDIIAIGKSIGNGYPVSVTAINNQTANELKNCSFKYMQSHQNDPLGAAIAKEVVKTIQSEDLISKAQVNGSVFYKMLATLKNNALIKDVRGRGLMLAVDLCDEQTGNAVFKELVKSGYIVCNRKGLFRIDPPLTITGEEFSTFFRAFKDILEKEIT